MSADSPGNGGSTESNRDILPDPGGPSGGFGPHEGYRSDRNPGHPVTRKYIVTAVAVINAIYLLGNTFISTTQCGH
jgi:hypothetical protein